MKESPERSKAQIFLNLLAQGMECLCITCLKSGGIKQVADEELEETFPDDEIEGNEKTSNLFIQCTKCEAYLQRPYFDQKKLPLWQKHSKKIGEMRWMRP